MNHLQNSEPNIYQSKVTPEYPFIKRSEIMFSLVSYTKSAYQCLDLLLKIFISRKVVVWAILLQMFYLIPTWIVG